MPKNKIINVNVTIDTTRLMKDFPSPSKNQDSPTPINHTYEYMVVSDNASISGQGTGDLSISAIQGDIVRFYATSEYNNYNNPVIVYGLFKYSGDDVFKDPNFRLEIFPGVETVAPKSFNPLVLQTPNPTQNFWFAENTVNAKGTEGYGLKFAVYYYDDNNNIQLFGYFQWDPTIIVK